MLSTKDQFSRITCYCLMILFLSGCNIKEKLDELRTFEIENSTTFTVPSSSGINLPLNFRTPDVQSSSSQTFENNNTRADLVENVNLKALELRIIQPETSTFEFLKSIKIYISNSEQGETLLAERNDIPTDIGSELSLETTGANLDEYIKKDSYNLRYEIVTRQTSNADIEIAADMTFEVRAKVL